MSNQLIAFNEESRVILERIAIALERQADVLDAQMAIMNESVERTKVTEQINLENAKRTMEINEKMLAEISGVNEAITNVNEQVEERRAEEKEPNDGGPRGPH